MKHIIEEYISVLNRLCDTFKINYVIESINNKFYCRIEYNGNVYKSKNKFDFLKESVYDLFMIIRDIFKNIENVSKSIIDFFEFIKIEYKQYATTIRQKI